MHPVGRAAAARPHVRGLFDQHFGHAAHRPDFGFREDEQIAAVIRRWVIASRVGLDHVWLTPRFFDRAILVDPPTYAYG